MSSKGLYYNNQGRFFGGVPIIVQVAVTNPNDNSVTDVKFAQNGVIIDCKFIKTGSTGGPDDSVLVSSVLRSGADNLISGFGLENVVANTVLQGPVALANAEVQKGGFLRATAQTGVSQDPTGVVYVTILPTD